MNTKVRKTITKEGYVQSWYDRHTRMWVTQRKDREGNQIGDADYDQTKAGMSLAHTWKIDAANEAFRNGPK
jgi:hypothetical protein